MRFSARNVRAACGRVRATLPIVAVSLSCACALAPAAGARTTVTVQGDSMALFARPYLLAQLQGASVISYEARAGRSALSAAALLESQRLGAVLVLAVGTDRRQTPGLFATALQNAARALGRERCLVLSTIYRSRDGQGANAVIERFAAAHPHTVKLADWPAAVVTTSAPARRRLPREQRRLAAVRRVAGARGAQLRADACLTGERADEGSVAP